MDSLYFNTFTVFSDSNNRLQKESIPEKNWESQVSGMVEAFIQCTPHSSFASGTGTHSFDPVTISSLVEKIKKSVPANTTISEHKIGDIIFNSFVEFKVDLNEKTIEVINNFDFFKNFYSQKIHEFVDRFESEKDNQKKNEEFEEIIFSVNHSQLQEKEKRDLIIHFCIEFAKKSTYFPKNIPKYPLLKTAQTLDGENALITLALAGVAHSTYSSLTSKYIQQYGIAPDAKTKDGENALVAIALVAAKQETGWLPTEIKNYNIPSNATTKEGENALFAIALEHIQSKVTFGNPSQLISNFNIAPDTKTKEGKNALLVLAQAITKKFPDGISPKVENFHIEDPETRLELFLQQKQLNNSKKYDLDELTSKYPSIPLNILESNDLNEIEKALKLWCDTFFEMGSSSLFKKICYTKEGERQSDFLIHKGLRWLYYASLLPICHPILSSEGKELYFKNLLAIYEIHQPELRFSLAEMACATLHHPEASEYFQKFSLDNSLETSSPLLPLHFALSALKIHGISNKELFNLEKIFYPQKTKQNTISQYHNLKDTLFETSLYQAIYSLYDSRIHRNSIAPILNLILGLKETSEIKRELNNIRLILALGTEKDLDELAEKIETTHVKNKNLSDSILLLKKELKSKNDEVDKTDQQIKNTRKEILHQYWNKSPKEIAKVVNQQISKERELIKNNQQSIKELNQKIENLETEIKNSFDLCLPTHKLRELFQEILQAEINPTEFKANFETTFGASRNPDAIIQYTSMMQTLSEAEKMKVMPALHRYINGVISGKHSLIRMQDSLHLDTIFSNKPHLKEQWLKGAKKEGPETQTVLMDTDDPTDLLLCGTETHNCLDILKGSPNHSKDLLSYLIDGKNRLLVLKKGDVIAARVAWRILWDQEKQTPVLFLEQPIFNNDFKLNQSEKEKYIKALLDFAIERAADLQLPLVASSASPKPYPNPLISLSSVSPYEYLGYELHAENHGNTYTIPHTSECINDFDFFKNFYSQKIHEFADHYESQKDNQKKIEEFEKTILSVKNSHLQKKEKRDLIIHFCLEFAKKSTYFPENLHKYPFLKTAQTPDGENALIALALAGVVHSTYSNCASKDIQQYGIAPDAKTKDGENALVAIALVAAKQERGWIPSGIKNYNIPSNATTKEGENALFAIALEHIQSKVTFGNPSYNLSNFNIVPDTKTKEGKNALLVLAQAITKKFPDGISPKVENFHIEDPETRLYFFLQQKQLDNSKKYDIDELTSKYPSIPLNILESNDLNEIEKALKLWCDTFFEMDSSSLFKKICYTKEGEKQSDFLIKKGLCWLYYASLLPICHPILSSESKELYFKNLLAIYEIHQPELRFSLAEMACATLHHPEASEYFRKFPLDNSLETSSPLLPLHFALSALKVHGISDEELFNLEKMFHPQKTKQNTISQYHNLKDTLFEASLYQAIYSLYDSHIHRNSIAPILNLILGLKEASEIKRELNSIRLILAFGTEKDLDALAAKIDATHVKNKNLNESILLLKKEVKSKNNEINDADKQIKNIRQKIKQDSNKSPKEIAEEVRQQSSKERGIIKNNQESIKELNQKIKALETEMKDSFDGCLPTYKLSELFQEGLQTEINSTEFKANFETTFGASRNPDAIIQYTSMMQTLNEIEKREVIPALQRYINGVITGKHSLMRMQDSLHLDTVFSSKPHLKEQWLKGAKKEWLETQTILMDTDDPIDLLLCTTETSSCLSILGSTESSKHLLGYLIDGKNRLLAVKKGDTLAARVDMRILWDQQKLTPVLVLGYMAFNNNLTLNDKEKYKKALLDFAIERATDLQLPLVTSSAPGSKLKPYPNPLVSLSSVSPYEYLEYEFHAERQGNTYTIPHTSLLKE